MSNGLSQAVATQTKTKVNVQQAALVGIAAVCTAMLLGAFTANFAILATGGLRIAATTSASCTNPANLACGKPVKYVAPKNSYYQKYTLGRGFVESNVTDGNLNTYGYTSDWKMGYEIDLLQPTDVKKIVITWKHWGFSPYSGNKMNYMRDYYVYGLSNGTWTKLAGSNTAPNQWTTELSLGTIVRVERLRVTSGWGLQVNGQWGTTGFNRAGNWLGLPEVEVYAPAPVVHPDLGVSLFDKVAQTVVAGSKGVISAEIGLNAQQSQEPVSVRSITFTVTTSGNVNPSQLSNFSIFNGDTELVSTTDPDDGVSRNWTPEGTATVTFTFSEPVIVRIGESTKLTIKNDIAPQAGTGTYAVGLQGPAPVIAFGDNSQMPVVSTYQLSNGTTMNVVRSGKLTITVDSSTPSAGLLPANTNGKDLAVFKALAEFEDIQILKLLITGEQVNNGGWDQVKKLYLYNGSTLLKEVTPTASDGVNRTVLIDLTNNLTNEPIIVHKNESMVLIFKADTPDVNYENSTNAVSGQGIRLKISWGGEIQARGAQSGTEFDPIATNVAGNPQTLFRSVPKVTLDNQMWDGVHSGTLSGGTTNNLTLYKFNVDADSAGDVGLYHLVFKVQRSNVTVSSLNVYLDNSLVAYESENNAALNERHVQFLGDASGDAVIVAGTSKKFSVNANVTCGPALCSGSSGSGSVQVSLRGDDAFIQPLPTTAVQVRSAGGHFIWTDFWRTPTVDFASTTASITEQWTNGYLVPTADGSKLPAVSVPAVYSR